MGKTSHSAEAMMVVVAIAVATSACSKPSARKAVTRTSFTIDEVLAANWNGLEDENAEAPDWIELHNTSDAPQPLGGWALTDEPDRLDKWIFPAATVAPDGRLVVFASGKDRKDGASTLHTNFRIARRGEYLALVRPDGSIAEAFDPLPKATPDQSVGRTTNGGGLALLQWPTPGAANAGAGRPLSTDVVTADPPSGLYDEPQVVTLRCGVPDCRLRFTTTATSALRAYDAPVRVDGTSVLRVTASVRGRVVSDRIAFTYVFVRDVARQTGEGRRVHCGKVKLHYDVDRRLAATPAFTRGLRALPSVFVSAGPGALLGASGEIGRKAGGRYYRPAWVEMVDGSGQSVFRTRAGIGSHSHPIPKRSLRVVFEGRHGGGTITAPVFTTERMKLSRLLLRGGANDTFIGDLGDRATYLRDQWVRDTQRAMSGVGGRGRFVHLYLDGLYWGLYNLVEHPGAEADAAPHPILRHAVERGLPASDPDAARFLKDLRVAIGKSDGDTVRPMVDLDGFADYLLLEWYAGVGDGLDNNWYATVRAPPHGLRFFAWDSEYAFVDADPHPASRAGAWFPPAFRPGTPDNKRYGRTTIVSLWRILSKDPTFVAVLKRRAKVHLDQGGALSTAHSRKRWKALVTATEDAIVAEAARWPGGTPEAWRRNVRSVDTILTGNEKRMRAALKAALR